MGIFDLHLKKEVSKNTKIELLEDFIKENSKEFSSTKKSISAKKFKVKGSLLSYDIEADLQGKELVLTGELKEVLILTILIIISILFTYGFGIIVVVLYTYLQKRTISKAMESKLETKEE